MTRPARASAKAVIVEEDRVLLIHLRHPEVGDFYELPGGGIQPGERLSDAARREVREETGYSVDLHELLWVRDFVAARHDFAVLHPPGHHAVELMFHGTLAGPAAEPHEADSHQVGVEWVAAHGLAQLLVVPRALTPRLEAFLADRTVLAPVYWGEVA